MKRARNSNAPPDSRRTCASRRCCGNAPPPAKSPERDSAYRRVEVRHLDVVETGVHRRLRVRRQLREDGTPIRPTDAIRLVLLTHDIYGLDSPLVPRDFSI